MKERRRQTKQGGQGKSLDGTTPPPTNSNHYADPDTTMVNIVPVHYDHFVRKVRDIIREELKPTVPEFPIPARLTTAQAAEILGKSTATILRWLDQGKLTRQTGTGVHVVSTEEITRVFQELHEF